MKEEGLFPAKQMPQHVCMGEAQLLGLLRWGQVESWSPRHTKRVVAAACVDLSGRSAAVLLFVVRPVHASIHLFRDFRTIADAAIERYVLNGPPHLHRQDNARVLGR